MRRHVEWHVRGVDRPRVRACQDQAAPLRAGPWPQGCHPCEGLLGQARPGIREHAGHEVSRLRDALARGEFVITGEVAPPHGTDYSAMLASVAKIGPYCHALNVTDNQGAT